MEVNKVEYGGKTLIDLTEDTVSEQNLLQGATAHDASGKEIVGEAVIPTKVSELRNDLGYVKEEEILDIGIERVQEIWDSVWAEE